MKELKLYQCEICGTQYKDKQECKKCEKHHIMPAKVIGKRWTPKNVVASDGLPVIIDVVFENGLTAQYRR